MDQAKTKRPRSLLLGAEHQLRQPLNAVSLLIGELSHGLSGRDRDAVIDDLRYALMLSNHWLDSLVELEKVDQGLVVPLVEDLHLDEVFARLREDFAENFRGQGLDFRVVSSKQIVRADPGFLRRILTVLLDNAAKFTREGKVLLGCRRMGGMVRIEVWDSGLGVAADEWMKVFDPYFRLENEVRPRERGLGLGLTLAGKLAALSGDQLEVTSRLGHGSCFSLTLRAVDPRQPRSSPAQEHSGMPPNPLDGARILLLEQDEAEVLSNHFALWGAQVQQGAATAAALTQELDARPALLVADHLTFEACGGWDLLSAVRRANGEVPAVILLGEQGGKPSKDMGVPVHFMARPVKPARLRALCLFALAPP
ncbi:HAMP domain-containing histidine kinase [Pelagibius litoralis]|uniref:histidine kinase n=1 Tax=Pelagibius litoralis TaxID=374515 RepID=A0A967K9N6_9PROT|nr:HAMP domain-containing sensor histidine kinase [Pelagibius litoralis]NIA71158.1 HAMP domain-containing histidine kinase [Pelagibius litoralis]